MNFVFRKLVALLDEVASWNITAQVLQVWLLGFIKIRSDKTAPNGLFFRYYINEQIEIISISKEEINIKQQQRNLLVHIVLAHLYQIYTFREFNCYGFETWSITLIIHWHVFFSSCLLEIQLHSMHAKMNDPKFETKLIY